MPGRTGIELISEVRATFPGVINILLTGYSKDEFPPEVIEKAGIFAVIEKPFSKKEVINTVRKALKRTED